ncbi:MAG: hypothetical protein GEU94_04275 [Micromonosporaceae bacterium]|nr:hypothetical protein [Micromonosporaceae bacterium]
MSPETVDKASTTMSGGLVLFTASLGAIGGLSGGVARMFRNGDQAVIKWAFGLILASVVLAVFARLWRHVWAMVGILTLSMVSFGFGAFLGMDQMVDSVSTQDRPSLAAQLAKSGKAEWMLKVQASSSGLTANDELQLLVYAQPASGIPAPTDGGIAVSTPEPPSPDQSAGPPLSPTLVPAGQLKGDRLFFAQSGPNADGVATQTVEVPIPTGPGYQTLVVTANLGDFPRDCEGTPINVRKDTELLVPSEAPGKRAPTLSCVTLAVPQQAGPTPAPTA